MSEEQTLAVRALLALWRGFAYKGAFFAALVVIGQFMIDGELARFVQVHFPQSADIENLFRIQISRLDDLLTGLVLLNLGGLCFALILRDSRLYDRVPTGIGTQLRLLPRGPIWLLSPAAVSAGIFIYLIVRLTQGEYNSTFPVLLALSLGLGAAFWLWQDRRAGVRLGIHFTWWEIVGLAGLLILAYFVLTFHLRDIPRNLVGDDGAFFETANGIANHGLRPGIFDPGVYKFPILSNVFQAIFFKVFGVSIWSWRFSAVVPGLAALLPLYILAREAFDRRIAFLSVFLLVSSPYFLSFTRLGYINSQAIFPVVTSLLFLHLGIERASRFYLFLAGAIAGLGFYTYTAARVVVAIVVVYYLYLVLARHLRGSHAAVSFAVFLFGLVLLAAPITVSMNANFPDANCHKMTESLFLNRFGHSALFPEAQFDHVVEFCSSEFVLDPDYNARLLGRGFLRTFIGFTHAIDYNQQHFIHTALVGPIATLFFIFGFWACVIGVKHRPFALILVWLLGCAFGLGVISSGSGAATHVVPIIPALAILTAIGLAAIATEIGRRFTIFPQAGWLAASLSGVAIAVVGGSNFFYHAANDHKPPLRDAILWAVDSEPDPPHVVLVNSNPIYDPSSDTIPPVLAVFDTGATFERLTTEQLLREGLDDLSNPRLLFFVQSEDDAKARGFLNNKLGSLDKVRRTTLDDGNTFVIFSARSEGWVSQRDSQRQRDLKHIADALEQYRLRFGSYPSTGGTIQSLCAYPNDAGCALLEVMLAIPQDPQGGSFAYASDGERFSLFSFQEGDDDPGLSSCPFYRADSLDPRVGYCLSAPR